MNRKSAVLRLATSALALVLMVPGIATAQTKVKSGYNMFSPEQDVQIGQESSAQVAQQLPLLPGDDATEYVNGIGEKLAKYAPGPRFDYRFRVVNASDLNAFALPGGYVYLNRGILESARNEGEVAGVLAHEIAHSALRHGTHNASKAYLTQAGIGILGGILGGRIGSNTAQVINVLGGFGLNALFLKYSRTAETEADVIGAQMLTKAGYSPVDMVNFFKTLAKTEKRRTANWMSSHPAPENRIGRIEKEANLISAPMIASTRVSGLQDVQASLRRLGPARTSEELARMAAANTRTSSPGQSDRRSGRQSGTWNGSVEPPSREVAAYRSRDRLYALRYPENWEVIQEGRSGVTLAPRGGARETSEGGIDIMVGAVVNHYEPFGNDSRSRFGRRQQQGSMEEATNDLVAQLTEASPHLRTVRGSGSRLQLPDGDALAVTLRGTSPSTRVTERITVVTRALADGHLIYLLFITPERDAQAYAPVLRTMINSMRVDEEHAH